MSRRAVYTLLGLGFSLAVAVYLVAQIDLAAFLETLAQASPWALLLAFACYVALNLSRAWRFRVLLAKPVPTLRLVAVTLYYNFLVRTLPFKAGEVSYIFLLRQYLGQPFSEGLSGLLGARIFDLVLVLVGGLVGLLAAGAAAQASAETPLILLGGSIAGLLALYYSGLLWRWAGQVGLGLLGRIAPAAVERLRPRWDEVTIQLMRLRSWRVFLPTALITLLIYLFNVFYTLVIIWTLGIQADLGVLLVVVTLGMVASNIPLSFAGFGITAAGWTFSLSVIAGVDLSLAASVGLLINGLQIIFVILTGLAGYLWLQRASHSAIHAT